MGRYTVTLRDHGQNSVFLAHALNSSDFVRQKRGFREQLLSGKLCVRSPAEFRPPR